MNRIYRSFSTVAIALLLAGCAATEPSSKPATEDAVSGPPTAKQQAAARKAFEDRVKALSSFAAGLSSEIRRDEQDALEKYFSSIKADPGNQRLALELARKLLRRQEVDKAIEVLEEVRGAKKSTGTIDALLGVAYHQDKRPDEAIEASESAIAKSPDFILGYRTLFQVYSSRKQDAEALSILRRAAQRTEVPTIFVLEVAELLAAHLRAHPESLSSERPLLLDLLQRCEKRGAKLPIVQSRLAEMYEVAGDTDKSVKFLRESAANDPSGEHRQKLLSLYLRTNQREAAIAEIDRMLREQPTNSRLYHLRGALATDAGDTAGAIRFYRKAIQFNEQEPRFYPDLAVAYLNAGNPDEALATLEKFRQNFKPDFATEFYTALAYGRKNDYARAVRHYTAAEVVAKADDPGRLTHFFYFQYGAAQERDKDYAGAEKTFRKVLEMQPEFADALNYLGYMWAERGENLAEAFEMISRAVAAEPKNPAFLDSMGWVLFMRGKYHEALPWLIRAVELTDSAKETDPTLYDHLADAYAKTGDLQSARREYERALRIEDKPEIRRKLNDIIQRTIK